MSRSVLALCATGPGPHTAQGQTLSNDASVGSWDEGPLGARVGDKWQRDLSTVLQMRDLLRECFSNRSNPLSGGSSYSQILVRGRGLRACIFNTISGRCCCWFVTPTWSSRSYTVPLCHCLLSSPLAHSPWFPQWSP